MDRSSAAPPSSASLDLLWESGDPLVKLEHRFGWASLPAAAADLAELARE